MAPLARPAAAAPASCRGPACPSRHQAQGAGAPCPSPQRASRIPAMLRAHAAPARPWSATDPWARHLGRPHCQGPASATARGSAAPMLVLRSGASTVSQRRLADPTPGRPLVLRVPPLCAAQAPHAQRLDASPARQVPRGSSCPTWPPRQHPHCFGPERLRSRTVNAHVPSTQYWTPQGPPLPDPP